MRLTDEEHRPICSTCGDWKEWVTCDQCDEGFIDRYEEDPNWFDWADSWERCDICDGEGGWYRCFTCAPLQKWEDVA